MTAPVVTTAPGAPAGAATEAKPGRRIAEAAASGDFAAVLAAVAGAAVPSVPVQETPPHPETPGEPDGEPEGHGAEVLTPSAAGHVPGPFPADMRPGAVVMLPESAAQAAPVRGEAATPAPPPAAVPVPVAPQPVPIPDAPKPETVVPSNSGPDPTPESPAPSEPPAPLAEGNAPVASDQQVPSPEATRAAAPDPTRHTDGPVRPPRVLESRTPHSADFVTPKAERQEDGNATVAPPVVAAGPLAATPVSGPTPVAAPVPAGAPAVVDQVVQVIKPLVRMEDGADEVVLELRPADLGTVRVEVRVEHGVVHATLHADQDSTADLLRQSLPELRGALTDAGLRPGDLGCGNGRHTGQGPGSQNRPAWGRDPDRDPGTPAGPALTHRAADPRRSLDVLL